MTAPMLPFEAMTRPAARPHAARPLRDARRDRARGAVPRQPGRPLHHRPDARRRRRLLDRRLMVTRLPTSRRSGATASSACAALSPPTCSRRWQNRSTSRSDGDAERRISAHSRVHRRTRRASSRASTTGARNRRCARSRSSPRCPRSSPRSCARPRVWLYEDSVLVKEPGAREATEWHQDLGYFHVDGTQLLHHLVPARPGRRRDGRDAVRSRLAPVPRDLPARTCSSRAIRSRAPKAKPSPTSTPAATRSSPSTSSRATSPCTTRARCTPRAGTGRATGAVGRSRCGTAATTRACSFRAGAPRKPEQLAPARRRPARRPRAPAGVAAESRGVISARA